MKFKNGHAYVVLNAVDVTTRLLNRSNSISLDLCRKSLDGSKIILEVFEPIPSDFLDFVLYDECQAKALMLTSEWME